ncbi:hypothetical protein [Streptomyces sp. NPDC059928]|uniref:hypothetical protein n=1 Tax=unclassified Streptomyces TaxID=2593676 RepID=UPI0036573CCC
MSDNPFGNSPWDEPDAKNENNETKESPMTTSTAHTQEGVTVSFKGGEGYDASLLVLRAATIPEMDAMLDEEAGALASLMKRMAKIQSYSSELNFKDKGAKAKPGSAGKTSFSGGKVLNSGGGEHQGVTDCEHGRTHVAKNGWEAYFCNADERKGEDKCAPAFLNKKTNKFELKN